MTQSNLNLNALRYTHDGYFDADSPAKAIRYAALEKNVMIGSFSLAGVTTVLLLANLVFGWSDFAAVILFGISIGFLAAGGCCLLSVGTSERQAEKAQNYFKDVDTLEAYLAENEIAKGEERDLAKRLLKEDFVNYIKDGKNVFLSLQIVSDGNEPYGVVSVNAENLALAK